MFGQAPHSLDRSNYLPLSAGLRVTKARPLFVEDLWEPGPQHNCPYPKKGGTNRCVIPLFPGFKGKPKGPGPPLLFLLGGGGVDYKTHSQMAIVSNGALLQVLVLAPNHVCVCVCFFVGLCSGRVENGCNL